jgi:hypothetical protein
VSLINTDRTTAEMAAISARAKDAAAQAVPIGKRAGTTTVQGVQSAMDWAAPRINDAVIAARVWAAPQLENAADAVTTTVAPRLSSALRATASQVRPAEATARTGMRRLLDWRWLVGLGAVAAAAGATAAVAMRRRYASATAAAKAATEPDAPVDESAAEDATRSQVNGQVTTPERS